MSTYKTPRLRDVQMVIRSLRFMFKPRSAIQGKAARRKSKTAAYAGEKRVSFTIKNPRNLLRTTIDKGYHS